MASAPQSTPNKHSNINNNYTLEVAATNQNRAAGTTRTGEGKIVLATTLPTTINNSSEETTDAQQRKRWRIGWRAVGRRTQGSWGFIGRMREKWGLGFLLSLSSREGERTRIGVLFGRKKNEMGFLEQPTEWGMVIWAFPITKPDKKENIYRLCFSF